MRARSAGLACLVLLAALGCGELRDIWELYQALGERYGSVSVNVSVENGERQVVVGVNDATLLALSPEEQVARAIEVGRFVDAAYRRADRVDVYEIQLVEHERHWLVFTSERHVSFRMTPAELR